MFKVAAVASVLFLVTVLSMGCHRSSSSADNLSTTPTNPSTPATPKKTFVILQDFTGDLKTEGAGTNGVDGADKLCQADSQSSGGTYKAMVVDGVNRVACTTADCGGGSSEHVNWVFAANTVYKRIDGTTVVGTTNSKGLLEFPLDNEWITQGYDLWTGMNSDWTTAANNCSGFTSSAGQGKVALTGLSSVGVNSYNTYACNYYGTAILCVEQ